MIKKILIPFVILIASNANAIRVQEENVEKNLISELVGRCVQHDSTANQLRQLLAIPSFLERVDKDQVKAIRSTFSDRYKELESKLGNENLSLDTKVYFLNGINHNLKNIRLEINSNLEADNFTKNASYFDTLYMIALLEIANAKLENDDISVDALIKEYENYLPFSFYKDDLTKILDFLSAKSIIDQF